MSPSARAMAGMVRQASARVEREGMAMAAIRAADAQSALPTATVLVPFVTVERLRASKGGEKGVGKVMKRAVTDVRVVPGGPLEMS